MSRGPQSVNGMVRELPYALTDPSVFLVLIQTPAAPQVGSFLRGASPETVSST